MKFKDFDGEYEVESIDSPVCVPHSQLWVGKNGKSGKSSLYNPATKTILPATVFDAEVAANHQCLAAAAVVPEPILI